MGIEQWVKKNKCGTLNVDLSVCSTAWGSVISGTRSLEAREREALVECPTLHRIAHVKRAALGLRNGGKKWCGQVSTVSW